MDPDRWQPPRCIHGKILLGCPHEDCPTQNAYLDQQDAALEAYWRSQQREAKAVLGLTASTDTYYNKNMTNT